MLLSEQEVIDCSRENYDCRGGQPSAVMDYILKNSLSYEKDYPYIAKKNTVCYKDHKEVPDLKKKKTEGRRL